MKKPKDLLVNPNILSDEQEELYRDNLINEIQKYGKQVNKKSKAFSQIKTQAYNTRIKNVAFHINASDMINNNDGFNTLKLGTKQLKQLKDWQLEDYLKGIKELHTSDYLQTPKQYQKKVVETFDHNNEKTKYIKAKLEQYLGKDMWDGLSEKEKNETLLEYCMRINTDEETYNSQQIAHQLKSEMIDDSENDWYKEKQNQEVGRNLREDIQKQLKRKQNEQQSKSRQNNRNYLQKGKGRK